MKCVVCKLGESREGHTTVTLERDGAAHVVRKVPAQVCDNCGEAYVTRRSQGDFCNPPAKLCAPASKPSARGWQKQTGRMN
jgi:YgiT-type zinc finger domain-containing protein